MPWIPSWLPETISLQQIAKNIKTLIIVLDFFFVFSLLFSISIFRLWNILFRSFFTRSSFIVHLSYCFVTKNMCGSRTSRLVDVNVHVLFVNDGTDLTLLDFRKITAVSSFVFQFSFHRTVSWRFETDLGGIFCLFIHLP